MCKNTLADLNKGEIVTVSDLTLSGGIRRRLQDIGLIPGTKVECVQKSPFGDPVAYLIRGSVIAIRSEDSLGVIVEP